jgi:Transposase DDE domain
MSLTYADVLTFVQNLTPTWVKPQQAMLSHVLCALAERPSLCLSELARALPDGPHARGAQSLHGRLKRLNRFLDNPRLDEPALFWRWYRLALHFGSEIAEAPALLPILLDTTYFEPFAALIASVPCGGRALPIAFTTYQRRSLQACFPPAACWPPPDGLLASPARRQQEPLHAASSEVCAWARQNHIEEQLLHYLWSFIALDAQHVVIVADRGFARASLFRWFLSLQRQFAIRFDGDTWLYLPDGQGGAAQHVLALRPGEQRWLAHAHYGQTDRVPVAVLAVWEPGQQEPWYIATNLADPQVTATCYRWRMRIEAGNRDEKTGVILREGGDHHQLTALRHIHRLLLAICCLHWLAALVGLQAYHDLADPQTMAPALETVPPDCPDRTLLDHGPALPPPTCPHRSSQSTAPTWLRRFTARGPLSYVRLGMEVLRDHHYGRLVRRVVRWLGLYLWIATPIWSPQQLRYRRQHWWPIPY